MLFFSDWFTFDVSVFQIVALIGAICLGLTVGLNIGRTDTRDHAAVTVIFVFTILGCFAGAIAFVISLFGKGIFSTLFLILIMLGLFGVSFLAVFLPIHVFRKSKYSRNPFVKFCADFCRNNNVAAVKVLSDRVEMFNTIDYTYFNSQNKINEIFYNDKAGYEKYIKSTAAHFSSANQITPFAGFKFSDYGYPNLMVKQIDYFADALCGKLGNYTSLERSVKAELRRSDFVTSQSGYSFNPSTNTIHGNTDTSHYDEYVSGESLHYERYVFRKDLGAMIKQQTKAQDAYYRHQQKQQQKQERRWD